MKVYVDADITTTNRECKTLHNYEVSVSDSLKQLTSPDLGWRKEASLRSALWNEVDDHLGKHGMELDYLQYVHDGDNPLYEDV